MLKKIFLQFASIFCNSHLGFKALNHDSPLEAHSIYFILLNLLHKFLSTSTLCKKIYCNLWTFSDLCLMQAFHPLNLISNFFTYFDPFEHSFLSQERFLKNLYEVEMLYEISLKPSEMCFVIYYLPKLCQT